MSAAPHQTIGTSSTGNPKSGGPYTRAALESNVPKETLKRLKEWREKGNTIGQSAKAAGLTVHTARKCLRVLFAEGLINHNTAYGYRGGNPAKPYGRPGRTVKQKLNREQWLRLLSETERGGYAGYNELLAELFLDWIEEKDGK
jgi:predicted ArsR family transcriptional regulator